MPIHLYWGDDATARERAVQELIDQIIEPAWVSLNLSRLDGSSADQAAQALNEARTAPFGGGGRVVLLQRSPFCERCPAELAEQLESALPLIPEQSHLVLVSAGKPDARLRTTKALRKVAEEKKFPLPAIWDGAGLSELVQRSAAAAQLQLEPAAAELLADTIGNDSSRLAGELEKLALYCGEKAVDVAAVKALAGPAQHNALAVGEALLAGDVGGALTQIDGLMAANEPPLRLVASLVSQLRGW
ncbi:MAG: DNA polymerase III subunit delta, partial [Synechococcus sp.]|nr:DNA polymerase III subunit delta [Synechococcus sp.]